MEDLIKEIIARKDEYVKLASEARFNMSEDENLFMGKAAAFMEVLSIIKKHGRQDNT